MKLTLVQVNRVLNEVEVINIAGIRPYKKDKTYMEVFFDDGATGLTKVSDIVHIYSET